MRIQLKEDLAEKLLNIKKKPNAYIAFHYKELKNVNLYFEKMIEYIHTHNKM